MAVRAPSAVPKPMKSVATNLPSISVFTSQYLVRPFADFLFHCIIRKMWMSGKIPNLPSLMCGAAVLLPIVLPALFVRLVYQRDIQQGCDSPSPASQWQFRLGAAFIWICGVALFFASMRFLSGSVSLNVDGVVGANSTQASRVLRCVVIATWSRSIALVAMAIRRKNCLLSCGIPSAFALILVSIILWLLFAGSGVSTRLPDDYFGAVVLGRFTWVFGWSFAYVVASVTLFEITRYGLCPNAAALAPNVEGGQSVAGTTPDSDGLIRNFQGRRLHGVRPVLLTN